MRILVWLLGQYEDCGEEDQPELHHDSTLQGEGEKCLCAAGVAAKIRCSKYFSPDAEMRVDTRLSPVRVGGDSLTRQVPEIESCDCEIVNPLLGKHLDHKKYHLT